MRLIEQVVSGLNEMIGAGRAAQALAEVEKARGVLGGAMLERIDTASLVAMLGPDRARLYVQLGRFEADAHTALGNPAQAERARSRASAVEKLLT